MCATPPPIAASNLADWVPNPGGRTFLVTFLLPFWTNLARPRVTKNGRIIITTKNLAELGWSPSQSSAASPARRLPLTQ